MRRSWIAKLFCTLVFIATARAQATPEPLMIEPAIAPDGSLVAFVSGGDLLVAPITGGTARRLVSGQFENRRPVFSPDGSRIAFVSTRTGGGDIYVMQLASGAVERITFTEGPEILDGWSADGKWLYYSVTNTDIARMADVYRVPSNGGTPVPGLAERYFSEYFSAPSPSGSRIAFTAYGENYDRWWRRGHSYLDASQIWIRDEKLQYSRLNPGSTAKELWPMWSPDGTRTYFISDAGGAENLWVKGRTGGARQISRFTNGRVLWPSISYDGKTIVFERDFRIWALDLATGNTAPIPIRAAYAPDPSTEHLDVSKQIEEFAVSPDSGQVAFISRGEVFLSANPPNGAATRITKTAGRELHLAWAPDSRTLAYASLRAGSYQIFIYNLGAHAEMEVVMGEHAGVAPTWSPDGKSIAFIRDFQEICVYHTGARETKVLAKGSFEHLPTFPRRNYQRLLAWSPDGSELAYVSSGRNAFENVWIVPAAGGEAYQVTTLATVTIGCLSWSADSRSVAIDAAISSDVSGSQRLLRFKPISRVSRKFQAEILSTGTPVLYNHSFSADSKQVLFFGKAPGGDELFEYSLEPSSGRIRQLSTSPGLKRNLAVVSGAEVWFLQNGTIHAVNIETAKERQVAVQARLDADFSESKRAVFFEAWRYLADEFYDPHFHGIDWGAQKHRYEPYVERARTPAELQRILSLMIGDLNASHLGVTIRAKSGSSPAVGRLGVRLDPLAAASGVLRVAEVVDGGPADEAGIRVGDTLLKVDETDLSRLTNLDEQLAGKVNKPVKVLIDSAGRRETVVATTIGINKERDLLYQQWVRQRRAYVEHSSDGQLGYIHLYNMGSNTMGQLAMEIDSSMYARKGIVIDVRNNYGGALDGHVLDVFSRKLYLKNVARGQEPAWQRHEYGQQAIQLPTVLVTNRHTISDGECFVEGYRAEGLGQVIGENTAGWVIASGGAELVEGSSMSIPTDKTVAFDGTELELHPRRVDIEVIRAPGEEASGKDNQLDTAVKILLKELVQARHSGAAAAPLEKSHR